MKIFKMFSSYRGLPRSIYILFFAIMVNRFGNFVIPFLAMFLTRNLKFTSDKTGLFIMFVSLAALPGIFLGGFLVDHIGRKRVLALFQFSSACCFIPCALYPSSFMVPWLMVLSVFFSETAQVAHNAMVSDLTCMENRKEAFSLIYLGKNIGYSIGPIIAGFLFNKYIEVFFLIDALTTIFSVILILLFTHETIPCKDGDITNTNSNYCASGEREEKGNIIPVLFRRPFFLAFLVINFFYCFIYVQNSFSMPLYLDMLFKSDSSKIYGLLMTTNAIFVVFASTWLTGLTRKNKAITNIAFAGILYSLGFGMIYYIHTFEMFVLSTLLWTMGEILAAVNTDVYMSEHSPASHRGRFNAARLFSKRAGIAFGPFFMGIFIKNSGLRNVWPLILLISIVVAVGVFIVSKIERNTDKNRGKILNI